VQSSAPFAISDSATTMSKDILSVYTSIPPRLNRIVAGKKSDDYQEAVICSWKEAGFRIFSVNCDQEIGILKQKFKDVDFISNGTTNERPKISSFFEHIVASKEKAVGIINADCLLFSYGNLVDSVTRATTDSVILVERLCLDPDSMRPTGGSCSGFDAFFFDTKFLADIQDSDQYEIGEPGWDHWFPLAMNFAGAELKAPTVPMILHVEHPHKWSWETFRRNGDKLIKFILSQPKDPQSLPGYLAGVKKIASGPKFGDRYVRKLTWLTFKSLQSRARPIPITSNSAADHVVGSIIVGLSQSKELYFRDRMNQLTLSGRLVTLASAPEKLARKIAKLFFD
jgi:hypothetical protein